MLKLLVWPNSCLSTTKLLCQVSIYFFALIYIDIPFKVLTMYVLWRKSPFFIAGESDEIPSQYSVHLFLVGKTNHSLHIEKAELHNLTADVHNIITPPKHTMLSLKKKYKEEQKITLVSFFFNIFFMFASRRT